MNGYANNRRGWTCFVGLSFSIVFASIQGSRRLGLPYLVTYLSLSIPLIFFLYTFIFPYIEKHLTPKKAISLAAITILLISVAYFFIHPRIDSGGFTLMGISFGSSDADNAIDLAIEELLEAKYPYYRRTFHGNTLLPMPGQMLLAFPFYLLLGDSAFQNIFWLFAFFLFVASVLQNYPRALTLLWFPAICSPAFLYSIVQGGDRISNSIYVLIFSWLLLHSVRNDCTLIHKLGILLLFVVSLSSRMNFLLIVPLVLSGIAQIKDVKTSMIYGLSIGLLFLGITLPFLLYDPQGFTPLDALKKLRYESVLPFAHLIVPAVGGGISLILAVFTQNRNFRTFVRNCFILQVYQVLAALLIASLYFGTIDRRYFGYGHFFLAYGLLYFGMGREIPVTEQQQEIQPEIPS